MNVPRIASGCIVTALLAICIAVGFNKAAALQRGPPDGVEGVEVLTRGPVHEAFAETVTFDPEPGVVVAKAAPDAIEELPPEQKPAGANVDWIPGYWAWDDERSDFLWISGIWRDLPPGRQWVSGYWAKSGRGSQWTSGYWADAKVSEVEYLPEPPATVEAGPNVAAPSADHTWLPGHWVWQQNRYAWRPGYWATAHANWVWIPAHYVSAPRGYVFVDGYYDYSVARRGVLFAPVYFNSSVYTQRGFSYSPAMVISPAVFASHLFLRPSYGHYYFGDYYASNYTAAGFSPWFSFNSSRHGYDPFYAHQRWNHRDDGEWDRRVAADFAQRRDHEEARPPRTWAAQRDRSTKGATNNDKSFVVAASLDELAKSKETPIRLQPVAKAERQQIGQRGQEVRLAREERQKLEAAAADPSADAPGRNVKPVKVKLPKSPIASQPVDRLGKDDAPPKAIEAPQADAKIEPKPRKARGDAESPLETKVTKREPRPEQPQAEPKGPKAEPRLEQTKVEPKVSKAEPRSEQPKVEPKVTKAEPRLEQPKAESKSPKAEPRTEQPKNEPKVSKAEPRTERPKVEPKAAKTEPRPERPKVEPKVPKTEPRPERPKAEPKGKSKGESKGPPPDRSNDKPQGKSNGESKNNPKQ